MQTVISVLTGIIIGTILILTGVIVGLILAVGCVIMAVGVVVAFIGLSINLVAAFILMLFFEIFLKMRSMPRVWIVKNNKGASKYLSKNKFGVVDALDDACNFNFYNPNRFYWKIRLNKIIKKDWRFKRISLMTTSINADFSELLHTGLKIDEKKYPALARAQQKKESPKVE